MTIKERHESLKKHLEEENPILLEIVQKYELLDNIFDLYIQFHDYRTIIEANWTVF